MLIDSECENLINLMTQIVVTILFCFRGKVTSWRNRPKVGRNSKLGSRLSCPGKA